MGYDSSSGRYSKVIQPIGEAERKLLKDKQVSDDIIDAINSVTFYYMEDTSGRQSKEL